MKTESSSKRAFSHAGAWLVSLEVGQRPAQARVFIWEGGRVAASSLGRAEGELDVWS